MRGYPQHLADSNWDVHVVSAPGPGFHEFEARSGVTKHSLKMERSPSIFKDMVSLVRWCLLLLKVKPDIVSSGTPKAGLLGMLASRLVKVPRRVYHLRGLRLESLTGLKYFVLKAMEKMACSCSTEVLAVSASLREAAIRTGIVSPDKIHVLGKGSSNGVDINHFNPENATESRKEELTQALGLIPDVPVIGFVGRLTLDKGLETLKKAHEELKKQGIRHQFLVVGGVENDVLTGHQDSPHGYLGKAFVQTGRVKDVAPYYPLMDLLTLPTQREGMPNAVLESQACGVPVVTTDVTGARDSIRNGRTGVLFTYGDYQELAQVIAKLLSERDLMNRMSQVGRRFIEENFSRNRVWELLDEFYGEVRVHSN